MIAAATGVVAIISTWLLMAATMTGIGLAGDEFLLAGNTDAGSVFEYFWLGFALLNPFLLAWHLAARISGLTLACVMALGAFGLARNIRVVRTWRARSRTDLLLLFVATLWVAIHAAGSPNAYDSAMYHMQAVRWANTYAVVPGLGNLHDRLAFNTSSTLYFALLNTGPFVGLAMHVGTGLLVVAFLAELLPQLTVQWGAVVTPMRVFDMTLVIALCAITVSGLTSTLQTDGPVAIVMLVAGRRLFRMLVETTQRAPANRDATFVVLMALLAACLKPSSLTAAPFFVVAALLVASRARREWWSVLPKRRAAIVLVFGGIVWLLHGTLLSGYPLYPSPLFRVPAEWSVPVELARAESAWVTTYARHGDEPGLGWVRRWIFEERYARIYLRDGLFAMWVPLSIALLSMAGRVAAWRMRPCEWRRVNGTGWWLLAPTFCGLLIWFVLAPSPRFAIALFWILAATCAAQSLPLWTRHPGVSLTMLFVTVVVTVLGRGSQTPGHGWRSILTGNVIERAYTGIAFDPVNEPALKSFITSSGFVLSVPRQGALCYDAALPCTPHPARNLTSRHACDGRPVFVTVGAWQQMDWPNSEDAEFAKRFMRR